MKQYTGGVEPSSAKYKNELYSLHLTLCNVFNLQCSHCYKPSFSEIYTATITTQQYPIHLIASDLSKN